MRLATTLHGETLDALAARVYALGQEPSTTVLRAARRELTEANPYLKTLDRVPPGTLVSVPEIEGAQFGEQTAEPDAAVVALAGVQFTGVVALMRGVITDGIAAQAADARASTAFLRSTTVKTLARDDDQLKEALPGLLETSAARVDDAKALQAYAKDAFAQIDADLADLGTAFG